MKVRHLFVVLLLCALPLVGCGGGETTTGQDGEAATAQGDSYGARNQIRIVGAGGGDVLRQRRCGDAGQCSSKRTDRTVMA